jgi:hypothetical protein
MIFDSGHWGVTFQNWMLIAVAIVLVWIAFIWLTRQMMRDSWYFLVALVWLVIVFCDVRSMRKAPTISMLSVHQFHLSCGARV